jgi:hypothetical protein
MEPSIGLLDFLRGLPGEKQLGHCTQQPVRESWSFATPLAQFEKNDLPASQDLPTGPQRRFVTS